MIMRLISYHDALNQNAGDSPEHRALVRAVRKSQGDRKLALRYVARWCHCKPSAIPARIVSTVDELLDEQ
jgi:hypothetical protein